MGVAFVRLLPGFALLFFCLRRERRNLAPGLRAAAVFRRTGEQLYLLFQRFNLGLRALHPLYVYLFFERQLSAPRGDEIAYARYRDAHFAQAPV